jgi:ribosomal protein S18 acetylase RimI-like enzyme
MSSDIRFRSSAMPEDIRTVREIVVSTGFFNDEEVDIAVELITDRVEKGEKSDYKFLFLDLDGKTVGYSCFGHIAGTQESFDFYWLAVYQDLRGKGLGRQLTARTEEAIREAGGHRVYIETSSRKQYVPTREFYLKIGYRVEAIIEDFYAPGDGKVILVKVV